VASGYPASLTHSPLTPQVVANLRRIRTRAPELQDNVFAKIGDSISVSRDYLHCLSSDQVRWGEHESLEPTRRRFRHGLAQGTDPFRRRSEAAQVGWSAHAVLAGRGHPLGREVGAIRPGYALLMFGTNDIEIGRLDRFRDSLGEIVRWLTTRGVVPILFTIPPRDDRQTADAQVPRYNAAVREIAESRQVPLVDYHRELMRLPDHGLGSDRIHPSTYVGPRGTDACDFTADGLAHGYNLRNLLTLQALKRVSDIL
jgi:hypothetical protein